MTTTQNEMALKALKKAEERIKELCRMVCNLSNNPKKVRVEDWNDVVIKAIQSIETKQKSFNGDWLEDTLDGKSHNILKCPNCEMLFAGHGARVFCKDCEQT